MSTRTAMGTRRVKGMMAAWTAVAVVGCSTGTDTDLKPTLADIEITGTTPGPLQLVVSTDFFEVQDAITLEINQVINTADTITVGSLPYQQRVFLTDEGNVLVDLTNFDVQPAQVRMRIELDSGQDPYDQSATMSEGGTLRYVFTFFQRVIN